MNILKLGIFLSISLVVLSGCSFPWQFRSDDDTGTSGSSSDISQENIYKNTELGFEIAYPSRFLIDESHLRDGNAEIRLFDNNEYPEEEGISVAYERSAMPFEDMVSAQKKKYIREDYLGEAGESLASGENQQSIIFSGDIFQYGNIEYSELLILKEGEAVFIIMSSGQESGVVKDLSDSITLIDREEVVYEQAGFKDYSVLYFDMRFSYPEKKVVESIEDDPSRYRYQIYGLPHRYTNKDGGVELEKVIELEILPSSVDQDEEIKKRYLDAGAGVPKKEESEKRGSSAVFSTYSEEIGSNSKKIQIGVLATPGLTFIGELKFEGEWDKGTEVLSRIFFSILVENQKESYASFKNGEGLNFDYPFGWSIKESDSGIWLADRRMQDDAQKPVASYGDFPGYTVHIERMSSSLEEQITKEGADVIWDDSGIQGAHEYRTKSGIIKGLGSRSLIIKAKDGDLLRITYIGDNDQEFRQIAEGIQF